MQRWVQRVERHTASMHPPALGGAGGGLVVGGGIGGANGTGGGGDLATTAQSEIKNLKLEIQELKQKVAHDATITMDNLTNVRNERVEDDEIRTEEREAMEGRLDNLENELQRQAALQITPAERAILTVEVPALQALVATLQKEVPALEALVAALQREVPALEARVTSLEKEVNDLKQGGGGQNGGAGGGVNSWAEWKKKGCAILGVRTASENRAPNRYDCFDRNCRTAYFNKQASLQSYASHVERVHNHNIKQNPLAAYLPRGRV